MRRRVVLVVALLVCWVAGAGGVPPAAAVPAVDYQPGVVYFPDWNPEGNLALTTNTDNYYFRSQDWFGGTRDVLTAPGPFAFGPQPDREPLLGWYDDREQSTIDAHILQAASRGIDHFAFYYFWNIWGGGQPNPGQQAIDNFRASPYKDLLDYYTYFVTTGDWPATEWSTKVVPVLVDMMRDPNYKRTSDGRPLVAFFGDLRGKLGGDAALSSGLTALRNAATAAGLSNPFLVRDPSTTPGGGFDGTLPLISGDNTPDPGEALLGNGPSNFNPRPWRGIGYQGWVDGVESGNLAPKSPNDWRTGHLSAAKSLLDSNPASQGLATFYAWNELGEGGVIEPSTYYGYGFLNALQETFGLSNAAYKSRVAAAGLPDLDPQVRLEFAPAEPYRTNGETATVRGSVLNRTLNSISGTVSASAPSGWSQASATGSTFSSLAPGARQAVEFTFSVNSSAPWVKQPLSFSTTVNGTTYQVSTFVVSASPVVGVIWPLPDFTTSGGSAGMRLDLRNYRGAPTPALSGTWNVTLPAGWSLSGGTTGSFGGLSGNSVSSITGRTLSVPGNTPAGYYDIVTQVSGSGFASTSSLKVRVVDDRRWDWDKDGDALGWSGGSSVLSGIHDLISTTSDPQIYSPDNLGLPASSNRYLRIRMQNLSSNSSAQVFFTTTGDSSFSESKSVRFTASTNDKGLSEYILDMGRNSAWTGTIKRLRIDPIEASGVVKFEHVRLGGNANIALDASAFASDVFGAGFEARRLTDGSVGVTNKWNSTSAGGAKWVEVDLLQPYRLSRWVVKHASAGGEPTFYNTRDFRLQALVGSTWTDVDTVAGNTAATTDRTLTSPATARRWRLWVTGPNQSVDNYARVHDLELYGVLPSQQ